MDINEQIKAAESLLKLAQDYIGIKKLLKSVKTGQAQTHLEHAAQVLSKSIKEYMEVI